MMRTIKVGILVLALAWSSNLHGADGDPLLPIGDVMPGGGPSAWSLISGSAVNAAYAHPYVAGAVALGAAAYGAWSLYSWWYADSDNAKAEEDPGGNVAPVPVGHPVFVKNANYRIASTGVNFTMQIVDIPVKPGSEPAGLRQMLNREPGYVGFTAVAQDLMISISAGGDNDGFSTAPVPLVQGKSKYTTSVYYTIGGNTYQVIIGVDPFLIDGKGAYRVTLEEALVHH